LLGEIATMQQCVEETEAKVALGDGKIESLLRELAGMKSKLAEAELMVKLYESGRLKPPLG
jgi:hypothetical protein